MFGGIFSNPTRLYDFNPQSGTSSPVSPPLSDLNLDADASYLSRMLVLPTGQVLFNDGVSNQLYIYTPKGSANPAYWPVIDKIKYDDGVFTLTGRQLNGPPTARPTATMFRATRTTLSCGCRIPPDWCSIVARVTGPRRALATFLRRVSDSP